MNNPTAPQGERIWLPDLSAKMFGGSVADNAVGGFIACSAVGGEYVEKVSAEASDRRVLHYISDKRPDRSRDVINQTGISFDAYNTNPVWLQCHSYWGLPIGKSVEHGIRKGRAFSILEYFGGDTEHGELCESIYQLNVGGFMSACSVGLKLLKWARNEQRGGLDIEQSELLEVSKVAVPDQPLALMAAKSAGINVKPLLDWTFKAIEEAQAAGADMPGLWVSRDRASLLAKTLGYCSGIELVTVDPESLLKWRSPEMSESVKAQEPEAPVVEKVAEPAVLEKATELVTQAAPTAAEIAAEVAKLFQPLTREEIVEIVRGQIAASKTADLAQDPAELPPLGTLLSSPDFTKSIQDGLAELVRSSFEPAFIAHTGRLPY